MSAAKKKLVVCGGSGFLGSRICKAAVARNWTVSSLSRSGEPRWSAVTTSPEAPTWASAVSWQKADLLKPGSYGQHLEGADAVVHSMGILLEADYKGVLQGRESIISGLQRAFASTKSGGQNPLERKAGEDLQPQDSDGQLTYELMNRDTAIALAQEAVAHKVPAMAYISAAGGAPVLPGRYIQSKRDAEQTITNECPQLRSVFVRPGFMYDRSRLFTMPIAYATFPISAIDSALGRPLGTLLGRGVTEKPISPDTVAAAVVEALEDADVSGLIETEQIEALATKAWRKNML